MGKLMDILEWATEMSIIIIRFSVLDMNMIKMIKMGSCFFLLHLNHKIKVDWNWLLFLSEADDATDFIWFWGSLLGVYSRWATEGLKPWACLGRTKS